VTQQEIIELLGRLTITPDQLHESGILPIGRNGIYEAIKRGDLAAIEIGKKKAIITAPLRKMLGIEAA
jgi:hypothetical protein